ncbi:MAG: hypothetical protein SGI74_04115 [Oligoflexia bacterium]|nr:hypothetical protein [Oligoflexia bacterium]
MRAQLFLVLASMLLITSAAHARTGPLGFATGFGFGPAGIDVSDGYTRYNIGGPLMTLNTGFHIQDFALGMEGQFFSFQGTITDYFADGGLYIKFYWLENWYIKYKMGLSRLQRLSNSGLTSTFTTWTGGSVGGVLGWDIIGEGSSPFRLSINAGAQRLEFGSIMTRQGETTSNMDLPNKMVGILFYTYLGLDWYL